MLSSANGCMVSFFPIFEFYSFTVCGKIQSFLYALGTLGHPDIRLLIKLLSLVSQGLILCDGLNAVLVTFPH